MKIVIILVVAACVLAICTAQAPSRGGLGPSASPNMMNLLMYRSMFDMNMLPAMFLSGHLGGGSGGGGGGAMGNNMLFPLMWSFM